MAHIYTYYMSMKRPETLQYDVVTGSGHFHNQHVLTQPLANLLIVDVHEH